MKRILLCSTAILAFAAINAQTTTQRLPLVEGLTSNTCGPCASWNGSYGPIIENNAPNHPYFPNIAVLKYQMDWPAPGDDPSFNDDSDIRRGYYSTSGIPDWYIDGVQCDGTQSQIDDHRADNAPLKISASYTLTGTTVDVTVQIISLDNLGSGNRCYIGLANKAYNYSGGTNGESSFKHVMRKMLPDAAGTYLPNLVIGDTIYVNESYTFNVASGTPVQGSFDLWNSDFEIVCFVQKLSSKVVQNATIAPEGTLGISEGDKDDFGMHVYPNPAIENTTIVFDADENEETQITVYNPLGEIVYSNNSGHLSGRQRMILSTEEFAAGIYQVQVTQGGKSATQAMMVLR